MRAEDQQKQAALIAETIAKMDIVITTALIPGRPAPKLITKDMVASMKPGSVIVDLAVETGGNCELSEPGRVVEKYGVKIVGYTNVPSRLAADASALYARNIYNFIELMVDKEAKQLKLNWEDKILADTCIVRDGEIVHPALAPKDTAPKAAPPAEAASAETDKPSDGQGG
jgi:NAD(P) transhydrogenase subunit alpha